MSRSIVRAAALTIAVGFSLVGQAFADGPAATAQSPTTVKKPVTATVTSARAPRRARTNYRTSSNNNNNRTGRRWSYNYSGVGFPGMEGGLTAAANRTTWGRRP